MRKAHPPKALVQEFEKIKKAAFSATLFYLWLGYLDSNQGNARFRVWCLTAWLYPNVDNTHNFNWYTCICQQEKYLFFGFMKFVQMRNPLSFSVVLLNIAFYYYII